MQFTNEMVLALRVKRGKLGMTKTAVAKELNLDIHTYMKLEKGECKVKKITFIKVTNWLIQE